MGAGCTANLCFCFVSCVIALWKNNHVFDGQWCIFADASVFLSCFCFFSFISLRFTELKRNYLSETTIDHKQFAVNHKLASTLGNMCVCTPFFHRAWCLVSFVQTTCGFRFAGGPGLSHTKLGCDGGSIKRRFDV